MTYIRLHGTSPSFRLVSFNLSHRSAARTGGLSDDDTDLDLSVGRRKGRRSRTPIKAKGYDGNDVYNDISIDESSAPKISTDFTTDGEDSNQSAEVIAETKYRLKSLEKEAQVCKHAVLSDFAERYRTEFTDFAEWYRTEFTDFAEWYRTEWYRTEFTDIAELYRIELTISS